MTGTGKDIVKLTNCKLDGGAVTAQTAAVGVRMESVGAELSLTNTDIDVNYYGIGLRNKRASLRYYGEEPLPHGGDHDISRKYESK